MLALAHEVPSCKRAMRGAGSVRPLCWARRGALGDQEPCFPISKVLANARSLLIKHADE